MAGRSHVCPGGAAGRRRHYDGFYGASGSGPVAVVYGNCQAEAVRVLLAGSGSFPLELVRTPPVHELGRADLPHLSRLLRRCRVLLSQPVRSGYRGLPIGTQDLEPWLPAAARVLRWPVLRYEGLHPYTAIVRHPAGLEPPLVPYHDLRTVAAAAGRRSTPHPAAPSALRSVAEASRNELRRREQALDVSVADRLAPLGTAAAHVVNHPGNPVLMAVAFGLQRALGLVEDAADPGRALLGRLRAPLEGPVLRALGLGDEPRDHWIVDGRHEDASGIAEAHLGWYADHPECVDAALERHADRMRMLGL